MKKKIRVFCRLIINFVWWILNARICYLHFISTSDLFQEMSQFTIIVHSFGDIGKILRFTQKSFHFLYGKIFNICCYSASYINGIFVNGAELC